MKNILQLQPSWNTYSEVWLQRMNMYIKDHLFAIGAFAPNEHEWNSIPIFNLYGKVPPLSVRTLNKLYPFLFSDLMKFDHEIKSYINRKEIETILIHFIGPALHFKDYLIKSGKRIVVHCHGGDIFWNATYSNNPSKSIHPEDYIVQVQSLSKYIEFISNSEFTSSQLKSIGIPENKIHLKYFGIDLPEFTQRDHKKEKLDILFLGRLVDFKGPDIVIQAFELACEKGLNAVLTIAGDGDLRQCCELLRIRSKYSDRIKILGAVDYITAQELYRKADVYTMHNCFGQLSHTEEAFGVSLIEAMSFGLPIVTADSSVVKETVEHGVTGLVVQQYSIEEHAEAFLRLSKYSDLRSKMGKAGRERIQARFTPRQERSQLFEILGINE